MNIVLFGAGPARPGSWYLFVRPRVDPTCSMRKATVYKSARVIGRPDCTYPAQGHKTCATRRVLHIAPVRTGLERWSSHVLVNSFRHPAACSLHTTPLRQGNPLLCVSMSAWVFRDLRRLSSLLCPGKPPTDIPLPPLECSVHSVPFFALGR